MGPRCQQGPSPVAVALAARGMFEACSRHVRGMFEQAHTLRLRDRCRLCVVPCSLSYGIRLVGTAGGKYKYWRAGGYKWMNRNMLPCNVILRCYV